MKKSELITLIREAIYQELPGIISEIKDGLRAEMLRETLIQSASDTRSPEEIREHIRQTHGGPAQPAGSQLVVDYKGEKVASGKGVLDWFSGQVQEGATAPKRAYSENQMTDFMSQKFGKKIQ